MAILSILAAGNKSTPPGPPASVVATAGNTTATVSFTAPVYNGGSVITGYTVTSLPPGGVDSNAGSASLSHTITGLTNGTAYTFTVTATNAVGTGTASTPSNSVTPIAPFSGIFTKITLASPPTTWRCATYHAPANMWLVSANSTNKYIISTNNGATWTQGTLPVSGEWMNVASNGTNIVMLNQNGSTSTSSASYYSTDGINWTARTTQPGSFQFKALAVNNSGLFCAVSGANTADTRAMTSPDGINWTPRTMSAGGQWQGLAWSGTHFIAASASPTNSYICRSSDGINWSTVSVPMTGYMYGVISDNNGRVIITTANSINTYIISYDHGASWASHALPSTGAYRGGTFVNGSFVIPKYGTNIFYTSSNGVNWTSNTVATSGNWLSGASGNGVGIVVGLQAFLETVQ